MIFQRSLIRELTQVAMAVFTVLLAIVLTTQVLKLFGRAAAGQLASDAIFAMVGFATLIGAPSLGNPVFKALSNRNIPLGIEAGLAIVVLAIILDRMLAVRAGAKK